MAVTCLPVVLNIVASTGAGAQSAGQFDTITTINRPPASREVPQRQGGDPRILSPRSVPAPQNPFATRVIRSGEDPAADSADTDTNVGVFDPTADPDAAPGPRPTRPVDGDFRPPPEPDRAVDGDFTLLRPTQPVDGADPTSNDTRTEDERAVFVAPGLERDPTLFDIEVAPILSERPRQLFRFEPFQPLGIRAGSFVILPSVETTFVSDSNVFQSDPNQRDVAIEVVPSVVFVSNWNVHAVEFRASGVFSKFREFDSEDAREYLLEGRGRLDLRRRTNIEGLISRSVTQESRSALDAEPVSSSRADLTTTTGALTFNHRFNRLRLQLRGSVTNEDTSDTTVETLITSGPGPAPVLGSTISNDDRDSREYAGAVRTTWEFKPTLFGFAELEMNRRTFAAVSNDDGVSRDSRGERYRVGVSFGTTDQILRGEVSIGYGEQRPDAAALQTLRGMIIDANLAWRMSALTSLLLRASTDFDDTTSAGTAGALTQAYSVDLRHAFRENVVANAGLSYS
ncbi:MAG: outer membrane beta-barrel protein, partial [Pseudomonadota bacterium]